MTTTSLSLGKHWEQFIQEKIKSGCYGSASEIVHGSLRLLEEREVKMDALRAELIAGENSGPAGELDMNRIKQKARKQAGLK